jgi:hypothetical protein
MFARNVSLHLKPNTPFSQFTQKFNSDVLPMLRKQNGFRHELTLINAAGTDVTAISLWDEKKNADAYDHAGYPEVLKLLGSIIEGTPTVVTSEVGSSTFEKNGSNRASA